MSRPSRASQNTNKECTICCIQQEKILNLLPFSRVTTFFDGLQLECLGAARRRVTDSLAAIAAHRVILAQPTRPTIVPFYVEQVSLLLFNLSSRVFVHLTFDVASRFLALAHAEIVGRRCGIRLSHLLF